MSGGLPFAEGFDIDFRIARDWDIGRDGEPMFWLEGDRGMSGDTTFLDIVSP